MKLFIGYATNEGQTRKIAQYVADRCVDLGHSVEMMGLTDAGSVDLARFDGAVLGGSVHAGHYQRVLSDFAADHVMALDAIPTLMISVSLAASGHEAEDWRALDKILADFKDATQWTPGEVAQVAGAYKPSEYDVFRRFIMRRIIKAKDPEVDPDWDAEFTDWEALDATVTAWLQRIEPE
ncbi:flavodoxin domain-containing protein [Marivita hallyeonensis]|uniref:Menaquinone-dependent protoporphyrinogen oxidase n=1 Tax=Marivita hallyeonensis TaxID=996342 RepID=A0A1M5W557_9RHOB|nr:flavodoxin domain-containing protein [Marivita hallyeonensis]SHH82590.1 menaquinone-dependent protoporphyrinogen oxidase [Marivita hallyeonensis]